MRIDLPKWPQMIITGPKIDPDLAKEIIFRTDDYITSLTPYTGGNDIEFNWLYHAECGIDLLDEKIGDVYPSRWEVINEARRRIGFIELRYVPSAFASTSFIYGPHGFVHPNGVIEYGKNVGKYPEVSDILSDFRDLARAFPWLELWATAYDREWCEEGGIPLVTFRVKSGRARIAPTRDLRDQNTRPGFEEVHPMSRHRGLLKERGLPEEWYHEFAGRVRNAVSASLADMRTA